MFRRDGFVYLHNIKFHLIQDIQHVILKIRVGLVYFVNQKHRSCIRDKCLPDFPHLEIVFDIADIPAGISEAAVVETGQCVVLIQGIHQFHA